MTKRIIAMLITVILMFSLTACNTTDVTFTGEYDQEKYTQITEIDGVSVLAPKSIFDAAEPMSKASDYESDEIANHIFKASDDRSYNIYQPGKFFLYVFDLGSVDGIEDKLAVENIPGMIGTSEWLKFETRNPNTYTSTEIDGNTQAIYGATITESMAGSDLSYNGYVTILHIGETDSAYCLVVGYGDDKNESTSKEIAENFLIVENAA